MYSERWANSIALTGRHRVVEEDIMKVVWRFGKVCRAKITKHHTRQGELEEKKNEALSLETSCEYEYKHYSISESY